MPPRATILRDSLLIVLAYMAARHFLYAAFPAPTLAAWSHRDALMSLPRLAAFAALWACNRWRWGNAVPFRFASASGWLLPAGLVVGQQIFHDVAFSRGGPWPLGLALAGIAATIPVVLFEEYAFRGGLLEGLRRHLDPGPAILLGSALFALFHVEAQPFLEWPAIFLYGAAWSGLRLRGLGLGWLAAIHFAVDAIYFLGSDYPAFTSLPHVTSLLVLLLAAVLAWPRGKIAAS